MQEDLDTKSVRLQSSSPILCDRNANDMMQKEKEEIEDLTTELELADEDEKIQYVTAIQGELLRHS